MEAPTTLHYLALGRHGLGNPVVSQFEFFRPRPIPALPLTKLIGQKRTDRRTGS
jgi:hypothetical protein